MILHETKLYPLIANETIIEELGVAATMEDKKKNIESLNLKYHTPSMIREDLKLQTYRETLPVQLGQINSYLFWE